MGVIHFQAKFTIFILFLQNLNYHNKKFGLILDEGSPSFSSAILVLLRLCHTFFTFLILTNMLLKSIRKKKLV